MFNKKIKDKLNGTKEELSWWRGYVDVLEAEIENIQKLVDESKGVVGYHLNDTVATWDKLLENSEFSFAEKEYKNMPVTVQYTPVYGGIKYIRDI